MKRNDNKKQDQNNQAEQKDKDAIIRVRSGLRAGQTGFTVGCCSDDVFV